MIKNENRVIQYLDDKGYDIFSFDTLLKDTVLSKKALNETIKSLIRSKYINQIERGKYCRHYFRDSMTIGSFIASNGIISYWNAMHYHGLTEQIPNTVIVKTTMQKRNASYFGVPYKFVTKHHEKMGGYKIEGIGNQQFRISDLEQTIVDCFDKPGSSGGYAEIIKAFYKADISAQKLVKHCKEENKSALTKRLAYLAELLNKREMDYFIRYAETVIKDKYSLFEMNGESKGKTVRRWRLILNIQEKEIREMAESW